MLFSIPISTQEIITDTPLAVASLRSYHIVAKKKSWMVASDTMPIITIVVDGKVVANKLPIYPFVLQKDSEIQAYVSPVSDSRLLSVPLAINTQCSEVKVSVDGLAENSVELVFDCSDVPVEEEYVTCFDTLTVKDLSRTYNMKLTEEAEQIFVCPYIFHNHTYFNPYFDDYLETEDSYVCNPSNNNGVYGEIRLGSKDEYMPDFDIALLSPILTQSWKDVVYTLNKKTIKNVQVTFFDAEVGDCLTVYLIHKKIFK